MIAALARPSLARLLRTPRPLLAVGAWSVLALGFALAERARGTAHGADHVLVEAYGALVLPLLAYTLVGAILGARPSAECTNSANGVAQLAVAQLFPPERRQVA